MDYRRLGASGLKVPVLSFGAGTFGGSGPLFGAWGSSDAQEARRLIDICLEAGVNLFDTADVYSNGASTDYIDLLQLHAFDAGTPIEEVLSTLDDLVRSGKLRYVGASNFSGWQVMKSLGLAEKHGYPRYAAHQVYYSLLGRDYEWELMPLGLDQGVGALVWSPLGWGRLTGKIRRGQPLPEKSRLHETADFGPPVGDEHLYRVMDELDAVAQETGKTVPQIAINWLLRRPTVSSVIIGARNEEQLRQNLGAVGWTLTPEQVKKLDEASEVTAPYPYFPYRRQEGFARLNPPAV
ncbi:aldo/keto reductase [Mesorhizobium sp. LNHC229A00]|uniref:aldo/keto reductase n=1 Tax=Mesorhizobium sp. LNHC229A00 TaxID=1287240 RepID=UPI0003CEAE00|nr:aldo/keto reductase [Mesorhizobium sp. LNHC229A00]ESY94151.1 aldo/keto reductase [Mesorhizobium sp. LNHC229A00]